VNFFLLLILAASLVPGAAIAQVSVNPAALMQLAGMPVPSPATVHEPTPKADHAAFVRHWRHVATKAKKSPLPPAVVPVVARPAPTLPQSPAPAPVVAKPAMAPVAPKPAAPPAPINIVFAADSAILPAGAQARLAPFCKISGPIVINARAPADPDDNSYSMRLSLARALAVRTSLSACGVASQNILPRALGAGPGSANDTTEVQIGLNP
jgi:hypothetical protein